MMRDLAAVIDDDAIIVTDVGQHQMWTAMHFPHRAKGLLVTSGGMGTMGFGLPAAIGAALANPERQVVLISGDGSMLMNMQELVTLARLECALTIVLVNNAGLGLVRQQQDLFFGERRMASGIRFAGFDAVARACGIASCTVFPSQLGHKLASDRKKKTLLCEVMMNETEMALPMVRPGQANAEMIGVMIADETDDEDAIAG
jgi:acetolactate synthase-1/2/3 large subunit